jgi:hypothetical protein
MRSGVPTLRDYLQVVRRRTWIIAQAVVLVPVVAVPQTQAVETDIDHYRPYDRRQKEALR